MHFTSWENLEAFTRKPNWPDEMDHDLPERTPEKCLWDCTLPVSPAWEHPIRSTTCSPTPLHKVS